MLDLTPRRSAANRQRAPGWRPRFRGAARLTAALVHQASQDRIPRGAEGGWKCPDGTGIAGKLARDGRGTIRRRLDAFQDKPTTPADREARAPVILVLEGDRSDSVWRMDRDWVGSIPNVAAASMRE